MNTNYASFGKRLVAIIIDNFILMIPGLIIGVLLGLTGMDPLSSTGLLYGLVFLMTLVYFAYFESSEKQATPGKILMKIKVADINGDRMTFGKSFLRNALKIVSGIILYIGFIMAAFTQKKQALHDMAAGAIVLDAGPPKDLNTTV